MFGGCLCQKLSAQILVLWALFIFFSGRGKCHGHALAVLPRWSSISSPSRNSAVRFVIPGAADRESRRWSRLNGFMWNPIGMEDLIGLFTRVKLLLQTRSVMRILRLEILVTRCQRMTLPRRHRRLMAGSDHRCKRAAIIPRRWLSR